MLLRVSSTPSLRPNYHVPRFLNKQQLGVLSSNMAFTLAQAINTPGDIDLATSDMLNSISLFQTQIPAPSNVSGHPNIPISVVEKTVAAGNLNKALAQLDRRPLSLYELKA